jgi:hypothetical protein
MLEFREVFWRLAAVGLCLPGHWSAAYAGCDEYNPAAPMPSTTIVVSTADAFDEKREELRTFVETGSLGSARAELVSLNPKTRIRYVFVSPVISRYSQYYGEQLKGIAVEIMMLEPVKQPVSVFIRLHQVCAQYFRSSFLSY